MKDLKIIEKSITKKFKKEIWLKFIKAIKDFDLIKEDDKIAVCISGGKDSLLLAKCFQELKKHQQINFELLFLLMDPGYDKSSLNLIKDNLKKLNIPIKIFNTKIFEIIEKRKDKSACYLCSKMRRGYLYNEAKKLGCNKIALAHHLNDVTTTILMSILYNGQFKTILPKLKSTNFKNMELIRPFYYIDEDDIIKWQKYNNLTFLKSNCPYFNKDNKREKINNLIKDLIKENKEVNLNIFHSTENVNLKTLISYKIKDKIIHFLHDDEEKI